MSFRNTIIVLILLVLIGGYALYVNHQPPPDKNPKVYAVKAKDIVKVDLRSPDRDIVLQRRGDEWEIVKPVTAPSEHFAVNSLVDQIAGVQTTGVAEEHPGELAPFGLAKPAVTVTVTTTDGETLPSVLVGKQTPIGDSVFIKVENKPAVMLAASSFGAEVNKHVDDLRSRDLFAIKPEDTRKITIVRSGEPALELSRSGGNWVIEEPRRYPADNAAVDAYVRRLTNARVAQFVVDEPSDLSKYGLASPSMTITLAGADGKPRSVEFGYREPEASSDATYARSGEGSSRPVFTITNDMVAAVNKNFDDLRDRKVLSFKRDDVGRITLAGGPNNLTLEKDAAGKWTVSSGGKNAPAEMPVVTSLLQQLTDLKATKIVADTMSDPQRYGMTHPTVTLTLYDKGGKQIDGARGSILQITAKPRSSDEKPSTKSFGYMVAQRDATVYEVSPQSIVDLENTMNRLQSDLTPTPAPSATASNRAAAPAPTH